MASDDERTPTEAETSEVEVTVDLEDDAAAESAVAEHKDSSDHEDELSRAGSIIEEVMKAGDDKPEANKSDIMVGIMLVFASVAVDMLGISIILPVLPFYALKFDANSFQVGLVFTAYALAQTISTPISGKLSDIFGRRNMILLSLFGSASGFLFQGLSEGYWLFLVARFTGGIFGASVPIAMAFLADVTTQEERPKYMAFLGSIIGAAFLFGPGIGSGLAQFSLQTPMFVSSGLAWLGFVLAVMKLKDPKDIMPTRSRSGSKSNGKQSREMSNDEKKLATTFTILLSIAEFVNMAAFTAILTMLGLYAEIEFGFGSLEVGFVFSGQSLAFVLIQILIFPKLVAKYGKHGAGIIGCFVFTAGLLVIPIANSVWGTVLGVILTGGGYGCVQPALPSLMSRYNEESNQGRALGTGQAAQAFARVVVPGLFGALFDISTALPFYVSAGCCMLTCALLFYILSRNRQFHSLREGLAAQEVLEGPLHRTQEMITEASKLPTERLQLLGRVTAELLVRSGYTADELKTSDGLVKAVKSLQSALAGDEDIVDAEVAEALRSTTNVHH